MKISTNFIQIVMKKGQTVGLEMGLSRRRRVTA